MRKIAVFSRLLGIALVAAASCLAGSAAAITVRIDYSKDSRGFFGANNPQGATGAAQARASLEAVAALYSEILEDNFSAAFEIPDEFNGSLGGQVKWFWKQRFVNPSTGLSEATINPTAAATNDFVISVGARNLNGSSLGLGGPNGFVPGFASRSGEFTAAEKTQIDQMEAEFRNGTKRGQATGFSGWGGAAAFDNGVTWHFNHTTNPPAGASDFYSVALHEVGHALGLGTSAEWNKLVDGTVFKGANALANYTPGGNVPLASADDKGHWLQTIAASSIYEDVGTQLPLMVPTLDKGLTRRRLTNLDAAALADIGWEIDLPGASASAATLASLEFSSGSASFAALSASIAPEPGSACLAIAAASAMLLLNPRRRIR